MHNSNKLTYTKKTLRDPWLKEISVLTVQRETAAAQDTAGNHCVQRLAFGLKCKKYINREEQYE